jgi:uncharacterized protein YkwD
MLRASLVLLLLASCALCNAVACAHARTEPAAAASSGAASAADPTPEVTSYDTHDLDGATRGNAADDAFVELVRSACDNAGLMLDGRLGTLAEALALASEGARLAPSYAAVNHEARAVGLVEPTPEVWVASGPNTRALSHSLAEQVQIATVRAQLTHCGAAAVREASGVVVALALSGRFLALDKPVAQRVEPGSEIVLSGKLASGFSTPVLAVTHPSGKVSREDLGKARSFDHRLKLSERGAYSIEILAQGPQGVTVVANFPVGAGVQASKKPDAHEGPGESTPEEVADKLASAIASERKARGLSPLKVDARLTAVALAHDEDMLTHGFIAHTSKTTGEAADRVKHAGLTATLVLENIGRGYSAQEIHQGLMESPGHRGNILHPDARELGIAVMSEREGSRTAFITTEVFTRLAREVELGDAPREIVRAINARRTQKHQKAAANDDGMARAAQHAAEAYANRDERDENALLDKATREVTAPPPDVKAIAAALVLADDIEQVGDSTRLLDPNLKKLGVGVAKLKSTDKHALVVVILIGLAK